MQAVIAQLDLEPESLRVRDGQAVPAPTRSSSTHVRWQLAGQAGAGWVVRDVGFTARGTLPLVDGGYVVADPGGTPRSIRTARLAATGLRSWLGLELYDDAPAGTSVTYRLRTGGVEYYWTGAAWAAATLGSHWSSRADVVGHVGTLTAAGRDLAVVARLATTDASVAPSFFGAAVAYGVREVGDLDDALVRTVLPSLLAAIRYTTVVELEAPTGGLASLRLSGTSAEYQLEVSSVEAVYDVTADAGEASQLAGSFSSGVWTPTSPVTAGHVVRAYVVAVPRIVVRSHHDAERLDRLPAVYVAPSGAPRSLEGQALSLVRNVDARTGQAQPAPVLVDQGLTVRVLAELGSDAQRLARALEVWLGEGGQRALASPVSGRIVQVRATEAAFESPGSLAQGVVEVRAAWSVLYRAERADILRAVDLLAEGGLEVTLTGS